MATGHLLLIASLFPIALPSASALADGGSPVVVSAAPVAYADAAAKSPSSQPETMPADKAASPVSSMEHRPFNGPRTESSKPGQAANSFGGWIGPTWWALILVIGLILAGTWAVKRWAPGRLGGRQMGPFRILSRWHLSAKQYLALIQLGRRLLLVGVTGQQISLLSEVTEPQEIEQLLSHYPAGGRNVLSDGFSQLLGKQQKQMADGQAGEPDLATEVESADRAAGQLGQLIDRVKSHLSKLQKGPQSQ